MFTWIGDKVADWWFKVRDDKGEVSIVTILIIIILVIIILKLT